MILQGAVLAALAGALGVDSGRGDGSRRKQLPRVGGEPTLAYKIWKKVWMHNRGHGAPNEHELASWNQYAYMINEDRGRELIRRLFEGGMATQQVSVSVAHAVKPWRHAVKPWRDSVVEMADGSFLVFSTGAGLLRGYSPSASVPDQDGLPYTGAKIQRVPDSYARGKHFYGEGMDNIGWTTSPPRGGDLTQWAEAQEERVRAKMIQRGRQ